MFTRIAEMEEREKQQNTVQIQDTEVEVKNDNTEPLVQPNVENL